MALSSDAIDLPRPFGPYSLVRRLAVGGMAEVYVAKAKGIGGFEKLVAIKLIHSRFSEDEHFVRMLVEEAKISVLLNHVNVAQIYDLGCIDGTYFIVMEYIEGADTYRLLRRAREQDGRLPIDVCTYVAAEVCNGLDYAHRKRDSEGRPLSIVHRDVSPQNILLSFAGEVKLVDFGIAKAALRTAQTEAGVIKGKYYYMSPEQAWGDKVDHRSDVFSVGVCLYEMLAGEMLYKDDNLPQLLDKVRKAQVERPSNRRSEVPKELDDIVMKALAKRPQDRWQSARDFGQALSRFLYDKVPGFTAARLSDVMSRYFTDENGRQTASIPLPSEQHTVQADASTSPARADGGNAAAMQPDQLAPSPQSVIFASGGEGNGKTERGDSTQRDVSGQDPWRPHASAGAAENAVDELSGYDDEEPSTTRDGEELADEPTVVEESRDRAGDELDAATGVYGDEQWDDSTLVDERDETERPIPGERPRMEHVKRTPVRDGGAASARLWERAPELAATVPSSEGGAANASNAGAKPANAPSVGAVSWPPPPATAKSGAARGGPVRSDAVSRAAGRPSAPSPAAIPMPVSPQPADPGTGDAFVAQPREEARTADYAAEMRAREHGRLLRWFLVPAAVGLLFAAGVAIAAWLRSSGADPRPVLKVLSVPRGAQVELDGETIGRTPIEIRDRLEVGKTYEVEVSRSGFESWTRTITAKPGSLQQNVVLSPRRATLTVTSEPAGAKIWVDGVLSGRSPLEVEDLPVDSTVELRASSDGYEEVEREVQISTSDLEPEVHLQLPSAS